MKEIMLLVIASLLFGCQATKSGASTWHDVMYDCVVMQQLDFSCGISSLATLMQCEFGDQFASEKTLLQDLTNPVSDTDQYKHGVSLLDCCVLAGG